MQKQLFGTFLSATAALSLTGGVMAQPTSLVTDGDIIGTDTVNGIDAFNVNSNGGYAFLGNLGSGIEAIIGTSTGTSPSIVAQEGTIDGLTIDNFVNAPDLSDTGSFVYRGQDTANLDVAFQDGTAIALEGNAIPAFSGPTYNIPNNPTISADGSTVHFVTSFTDGDGFGGSALLTNGGADAVAQADFSGPGAIDTTFTTSIDGAPIGNASDPDYEFSADGSQFVLPVSLFGVSSATNATLAVGSFDGTTVTVGAAVDADGTVMREDNALGSLALNGRTIAGAKWGSFGGQTGIADDGTFMVSGNLDTGEDFLAIDGILQLADGDAFSGGVLDDIDAAELDNNGNWAALIEVLLPDTSTKQALIYNGSVVFETGFGVDVDGSTETLLSFATGDDVLGITNTSGSLSDIYFIGETASGTSLFSVSSDFVIPEPASLGLLAGMGLLVASRRQRTA